jgi:hypothetical protein
MMDLGMLPPMSSVFSFDFLGASASKSYTLAGAFVRWAMDRYGLPAVRAWYSGTPIETVTHSTWPDLDAAFRADIARTALPPEALAYAKARFERPAIFGRKCPHVVDALRRKADGCRESLQVDRAVALYDEVLTKDPHDDAAVYGRGLTQLRYGDRAIGKRELSALAVAPGSPRTWRDRATDALADAELLAGSNDAAAVTYGSLAAASVDEDFGRTEEVKALASVDPSTSPPTSSSPARGLANGSRRPAAPCRCTCSARTSVVAAGTRRRPATSSERSAPVQPRPRASAARPCASAPSARAPWTTAPRWRASARRSSLRPASSGPASVARTGCYGCSSAAAGSSTLTSPLTTDCHHLRAVRRRGGAQSACQSCLALA